MSGVSKVLVVEDHRAILDHILSHSATIFPDAQVTVISEPSAIDELEGTYEMGLIDPGFPEFHMTTLTPDLHLQDPYSNGLKTLRSGRCSPELPHHVNARCS